MSKSGLRSFTDCQRRRYATRLGRPSVLRAVTETLEDRRLLSASPQAQFLSTAVNTGESTVTVTVIYADDVKIDVNSVGQSDLTVAKPGQAALTLHLVSIAPTKNATPAVANYLFTAPGGWWDAADNGDYVVTLGENVVFNVDGVGIASKSSQFTVNVGNGGGVEQQSDRQVPKIELDAPDKVRTAGGSEAVVTVTYSDDRGIDAATVGVDDVVVATPSGQALEVTGVSKTLSNAGQDLIANYTVRAPGGAWDAGDNGQYLVVVKPEAVRDLSNRPINTASEWFEVDMEAVTSPPPASPPPASPPPASPPPASPPPASPPPVSPPPPVATSPRVTVSPPTDISVEGGASQTIAVTYEDADGVALDSIGIDDLAVTGPAGPLQVTGVQVEGPATQRTATYTVAAPGGAWDAADSGVYNVTVKAGEVLDAAGTAIEQADTSFDVAIAAKQPVIDESFSGGTAVLSGFVAEAAITLEDGRLVLAGRQGNVTDGSSQAVLKRLNPDGSADSTFGQNGVVTSPAGQNAAYYALTQLPDGTLVAAGTRNGDLLVARHKSNGSLDKSFGLGGQQTIDLGSDNDTAYSVAPTADGGVVAGGASNGSFAFARFTSAGSPDTFFGARGAALFALGEGSNVIGGLVVQPDGAIVGVGSAGDNIAILRLLPGGGEDTSFGDRGAVLIDGLQSRSDLGSPDHTLGIALQADGKILMTNRAGNDFAVARLNPNGTADTTFGNGGTATIDFGGDDDADAVLVQGTGEVLVVGTTTVGGGQIAVAALHPDGSLDTRFGTNGLVTLDPGVASDGRALHIGTLVLRAFASARGDQVVVGGSDASVNAVSSSGLRRLNVPGSGLLGSFGSVSGKNRTLRFVDGDGTVIRLALKGGSGQAFYDGANIDLVLSGTSEKSVLNVKAKGGDQRLTLRDLQADGGLRTLNAKQAAMSGTFWVGGDVGKVVLGNVSGTLAAAGSIGTLKVAGDASGATVLAGANLGSDHRLGGAGMNVDSYQTATIGKLAIGGNVAGSIFGAGLDRGNSLFLDQDDQVVGGAASVIQKIVIRGSTDAQTRFVAGAFGAAKLPEQVSPEDDRRFEVR